MEFKLEERMRRTVPQDPLRKPGDGDGDGGPRRPEVSRPDTKRLLERMKRVDPDSARRYRQRSGE
jgi:hypothetical protein